MLLQFKKIVDIDVNDFSNATFVLYNRVPKSGSTSTSTFFSLMAKRLQKYTYIASKNQHVQRMPANKTKRLVRVLSLKKKPLLYQRHLHFIDFDTYGGILPVYVNMVRKPFDRFLSEYHYSRIQRKPMPTWKRELPFESCVLNNCTECQALNAFQLGAVPYFCGQSDVCMTPCQAAVDKAIDNINKHYGAIGLIEDFVHSIALFEQTMPKMFGNMTEIVSDILLKRT